MAITTICDVYCCIETINNKYVAAECSNPKLAEEYLAILDKVTVLIGLYGIVSNTSNSCYDATQATAYLTEIATLTNCSETCGCS
jgi:hypothetical protein|tara:strand:+ start:2075 stop:2329 length:255 start_codon:yes stop_codon:yes gene_type:complete